MAFALFSFYFFLKIGLKNYYAFLYSLGVSILGYPSIGTPFIDHNSVIFSIMAMYSISLAILLQKNFFWFLTPVLISISFFSKQIPSSYLLLLFFIVFFYFIFKRKISNKNLMFLFFGIFLSVSTVASIFYINEIPYKNFLIQYILYPISLGDERIDKLQINFNNLINQFKFIYLVLIPLALSIFFSKDKEKKEFIISLFFLFSILVIIYCQLLTKNQVLIYSLIPISAALSHAYTLKYLNKKYLIYFILIIFIFSTLKYHFRYNDEKKFMELVNADLGLAVNSGQLDSRLNGLKWITPNYINQPLDEINQLISIKNILSNHKGKKIIITDYQFFSSLLENKIASPNKWYDINSIPNTKNKYYYDHKKFFTSKVREKKIEHIFFIGKNKHKMDFFQQFISENNCVFVNEIKEMLIEFNIKKCRF